MGGEEHRPRLYDTDKAQRSSFELEDLAPLAAKHRALQRRCMSPAVCFELDWKEMCCVLRGLGRGVRRCEAPPTSDVRSSHSVALHQAGVGTCSGLMRQMGNSEGPFFYGISHETEFYESVFVGQQFESVTRSLKPNSDNVGGHVWYTKKVVAMQKTTEHTFHTVQLGRNVCELLLIQNVDNETILLLFSAHVQEQPTLFRDMVLAAFPTRCKVSHTPRHPLTQSESRHTPQSGMVAATCQLSWIGNCAEHLVCARERNN